MKYLVRTFESVAALSCLVLAVQLQVRVLEEPYLRRVHGRAYLAYASCTGRFVLRVGRLRTSARAVLPVEGR